MSLENAIKEYINEGNADYLDAIFEANEFNIQDAVKLDMELREALLEYSSRGLDTDYEYEIVSCLELYEDDPLQHESDLLKSENSNNKNYLILSNNELANLSIEPLFQREHLTRKGFYVVYISE